MCRVYHFFLLMKDNSLECVEGRNMIDACLKTNGSVDWKSVKSYQEDGGPDIQFSL